LAIHPISEIIFNLNQGPRGGEELNILFSGNNYGWPENNIREKFIVGQQ
jgi:Glucose/sorbosone dehydrogenases